MENDGKCKACGGTGRVWVDDGSNNTDYCCDCHGTGCSYVATGRFGGLGCTLNGADPHYTDCDYPRVCYKVKADGEEVRLTEREKIAISDSIEISRNDNDVYSAVETILTARRASQLKDIQERFSKQFIYNIVAKHSGKYFYYDTLKETLTDKFNKSMSEIDVELADKIARAIHDKISEVGK